MLNLYMFHLLTETFFVLSFHYNTYISNLVSDLFLSFLGLFGSAKSRIFTSGVSCPRYTLVDYYFWMYWMRVFMQSSYFAASDGRPWVKMVYLSLVMLLFNIVLFKLLKFLYRYPVQLQTVPVPPSCFTWFYFPMVMLLKIKIMLRQMPSHGYQL